jgi:glycoprotein-N-acetylgalactosamine 3-beta-galactosyltransferase
MSGGSGYVLTKEAIRRFVEKSQESKGNFTSGKQCVLDHEGAEDLNLGKGMANLIFYVSNILISEKRDLSGRIERDSR